MGNCSDKGIMYLSKCSCLLLVLVFMLKLISHNVIETNTVAHCPHELKGLLCFSVAWSNQSK